MFTRTNYLRPLVLLTLAALAASVMMAVVLASPAQAATFTVANTNDSGAGSLRQAIDDANATADPDEIIFAQGLSGTILLASPLPAIFSTSNGGALTIDAESANITISGDNKYRVFTVGSGAKLTLNNLTVANGAQAAGETAGVGGGIYNSGTLTVSNSTLSGNSAFRGFGGGIWNLGSLEVNNSTFSGNSATSLEPGGGLGGGGILNQGGTLTVNNSTFSGNSASTQGGGIGSAFGSLEVNNSTFSGNSASNGGGIGNFVGSATLKNTIVANSPSGRDCVGASDGGYNLVEDGSCRTAATSLSGDPMLGDLADNGGPTMTHALLEGSPAIDKGFSFGATTDQRGQPRPHDFTNVDNAPGGDGSDIGAFELTVNNVNRAPELAAIGNKEVDEGQQLSFTAQATDPDNDAISYSLVDGDSCASGEICSVPDGANIGGSSGEFSWTPTEQQGPGTYKLKVKATDNGSPNLSDEEQITITVAEVNVAPELASIGDKQVDEGQQLSFTAQATDADEPANNITYSLAASENCTGSETCQVPSGASIDPNTGEFSWTPSEAQGPGTYKLKVKATDDGSPNLSAEEQITITVAEVNQAPVLDPIGNKEVDENSQLSFTANATDNDVPANNFTYSLVAGESCASGETCQVPSGASIDPNTGEFSWTPGFSEAGTYKLKVKATDDGSPNLSAEEQITITVNNVNRPPVATGDTYSVNEDATLTANGVAPNPAGVLSNDSDAEGDNLTAVQVSAPTHGSLILNKDGSFTYTPNANYNGPDSFTYKANDGTADSNVATVSITVKPVNDAPTVAVAAGGSCDTSTKGTINLTVADVDSNADTLTLTGASSNTSLVPNTAQNITFGGSGANRTVTINAVPQKTPQSADITITVSDGAATNTTPLKIKVMGGTDKKETIGGTSGADMIFGFDGNNTINANTGNDLLCGGNVSDTLRGDNGNDTLSGGDGNDTLTGGKGADSFSGGLGTDTATDFNVFEGDTKDNTIP